MSASKTIGRYEIIEELGHGAMGAVYRAKDPAMDRIVALKTILGMMLSGPQAAEFRERFYREARAAGRLAHPGIVPVFDVGEHDGVPFLVMEYVNGRTLADATRGGERYTLERVCEIGQQVAEALGYAHQNGVVHRDIKPANILLTSRETHGIERPKITDFGVAKLITGQVTSSGQMLGTPAFMPPEQFTGAPIDGRADLFSLGVILYWMSTGEQAFPGETVTAVSYKVVHTEPVPPRKLNPAIPARLEQIIEKCLMKSPAERYQTGEELARDLAALRAGQTGAELRDAVPMVPAMAARSDVTLDSDPTGPTLHHTTRVPAPVKSEKRRNRLIVAAAAAAALVVGGWFALRSRPKAAASLPAPPAAIAAAPATTAPAAPVPAPPSTSQPSPQPSPASEYKPAAKPPRTPKPAAAPAPRTKVPAVTPPPVESPKAEPLAPAPAPVEAPLGFDPKALNPNENAKVRIEADHFPKNVDFTVEMNGKAYFRRPAGGAETSFENLFVPPGIWEFRVVAGTGANRVVSNIVSAEFKAKKRRTLKVELRIQGKGADTGRPLAIYPDSQIFVTLK